jgi:hypothetical protein
MGTQALDTKRFTSPAFKFFVVFMPRTFTVWVVGSPATSESQVQQNQLPRNTTRETPPQLLQASAHEQRLPARAAATHRSISSQSFQTLQPPNWGESNSREGGRTSQ